MSLLFDMGFDFEPGSETLEQREFDRLADYLRRARWNSGLAIDILIGVAPEESPDASVGAVAWLPGANQEWRELVSNDPYNLAQHIRMERDELEGFIFGEARFPSEWIDISLNKKYVPCWLPTAQAAPELASYLPSIDALKSRSSQSSGGITTRNESSQYKAKQEIVARFDALADTGDFDLKAFMKSMIETFCSGPSPAISSDRTVTSWIRQLRDEREGVPRNWVSEIRRKQQSAQQGS